MTTAEMKNRAQELAERTGRMTRARRAAAILDALKAVDAAARLNVLGETVIPLSMAQQRETAAEASGFKRGAADQEALIAIAAGAAFKQGAASVREALGVQPAGDGYVFLRGFWDSDDDSTMLSRECSAPHAWAALTGEDGEVSDGE